MSELKAFRIIQGDTGGCGAPSYKCDTNGNLIEEWSDYREVYDKSEVDKVIAELNGQIESLRTKLIEQTAQRVLAETQLRRNNYKRCLDKASYWVAVSYQYVGDKHRRSAERHRRKWLELANKFKEAK